MASGPGLTCFLRVTVLFLALHLCERQRTTRVAPLSKGFASLVSALSITVSSTDSHPRTSLCCWPLPPHPPPPGPLDSVKEELVANWLVQSGGRVRLRKVTEVERQAVGRRHMGWRQVSLSEERRGSRELSVVAKVLKEEENGQGRSTLKHY